jgi:hypothetical protein
MYTYPVRDDGDDIAFLRVNDTPGDAVVRFIITISDNGWLVER